MTSNRCFKKTCELEVTYICYCSSPETYSCEVHLGRHLKLKNRTHNFDLAFCAPWKGTKDAILRFLTKEKSKNDKLKKKALAYTSKHTKNSENIIKKPKLDYDSEIIKEWIEKISQATKISTQEKDSVLLLLTLQPEIAVKKLKNMIPAVENLHQNKNIVEKHGEARKNQKVKNIKEEEILEKQKGIENLSHIQLDKSSDIELDFRKDLPNEYQANDLYPLLNHSYQKYNNAYYQNTLLYLIGVQDINRTNIIIYDTKNGKEKLKELKTPEWLNYGTCITRLRNNELFCYGKYPASGISLIIDKNFHVRVLPSGAPHTWPSAIYFNNFIYCFGGKDKNHNEVCSSAKFNLYQNRWIKLASMPQPDWFCSCAIFNGNILIARRSNRNILIYSADIDNFSTIAYGFTAHKSKTLVYAKRLYLFELWEDRDGKIYESVDEYAWNYIANSKEGCTHIFYLYNGENIYFGWYRISKISYYKFCLKEKVLIKL